MSIMKFNQLCEIGPKFKQRLEQEGIINVSGLEALSDEQLLTFGELLSHQTAGQLRFLEWDFGVVFKMRYDPDASNYLFSSERVPLHWDGAFRKHVPSYIMFYCDYSSHSGGASIFVDTEALLQDVDEALVARWKKIKITYRTEKMAHYGGTFTSPTVCEHPNKGVPIIRFGESVNSKLNPVDLEIESDYDGFYDEMVSHLYDERYLYRHNWKQGDLVLIDNHRMLHGRDSLGENTGRRFRRVHIL